MLLSLLTPPLLQSLNLYQVGQPLPLLQHIELQGNLMNVLQQANGEELDRPIEGRRFSIVVQYQKKESDFLPFSTLTQVSFMKQDACTILRFGLDRRRHRPTITALADDK